MREIKFRGKSKLTGKWVYGNYDFYIFIETNLLENIIENKNELPIPIDIKTLGEYTGLKDRNMKEIYEGDVVQALFYGQEEPKIQGVVAYVEAAACYMVIANNGDEWELGYLDEIEKIGNKWDNPELLEEGE